MSNLEEALWAYIDGNCSNEELETIEALIAGDEAVRLKYQALLSLNAELSAAGLDEPSMAFTYNVMEAIRTEHARQPFKAAINTRIIWTIAGFFILTILVLMVLVLKNVSFNSLMPSGFAPAVKLPLPAGYIAKQVTEGVFFFDLVLGLYLFDAVLRRKNQTKSG